jgi:hypothetical protein
MDAVTVTGEVSVVTRGAAARNPRRGACTGWKPGIGLAANGAVPSACRTRSGRLVISRGHPGMVTIASGSCLLRLELNRR